MKQLPQFQFSSGEKPNGRLLANCAQMYGIDRLAQCVDLSKFKVIGSGCSEPIDPQQVLAKVTAEIKRLNPNQHPGVRSCIRLPREEWLALRRTVCTLQDFANADSNLRFTFMGATIECDGPVPATKIDPSAELRKLEEIALWDEIHVQQPDFCTLTFSRQDIGDDETFVLHLLKDQLGYVAVFLSALVLCGREVIYRGEPFNPFEPVSFT
jgi:hypothetical protein